MTIKILPVAPRFSFDEASHTYRLGDMILPSVTGILDAMYPRQWNPGVWYMTRGSAIHKAIALHIAGKNEAVEQWMRDVEAVMSSEDSYAVIGKFKAATKFLSDCGYAVLDAETPMVSAALLFAGTRDARLHATAELILCDWKSSIEPRVELQLGGYHRLSKDFENSSYTAGVAVELKDDGQYKCTWYTKRQLELFAQEFVAVRSAYGSGIKRSLFPQPKKENAV